MLRLTSLANKYQKRTLRALYAQTQATPYDVQLDPSFNRNAGALSGGTAVSGALAAIYPGFVAVKEVGEMVKPSVAASSSNRAFGLFAQFVGGQLSDIPTDFDRVSVWRGAGGVFEILAPAFDGTSLSTYAAAEDGTAANEVYLNSSSKAQLVGSEGANVINNTARLINYLSSNAIIVELLV